MNARVSFSSSSSSSQALPPSSEDPDLWAYWPDYLKDWSVHYMMLSLVLLNLHTKNVTGYVWNLLPSFFFNVLKSLYPRRSF